MRERPKRNFKAFIFGILGFGSLVIFINQLAPASPGVILIFYLIFFLSANLISFYLLNNARRAFLLSLGLTVWLILRQLGLREIMYVALLAASLLSLEILFSKK